MAIWGSNKNMPRKLLEFLNGKNCKADEILLPHNCKVVLAYCGGLKTKGIITEEEFSRCKAALIELEGSARLGKIKIGIEEEDSHTVIENHLIQMLGDTGKKIHIGKSRNDEALCVLRLYCKEKLGETKNLVLNAVKLLEEITSKHKDTEMPGYTHMKKAMPTTFSYWCKGFANLFEKDLKALEFAVSYVDYCPLGTAAGFGSTIKLDWKQIANELGFSKIEENGYGAQNSRMKEGAMICFVLLQAMMDVNKMATDLMLWNTEEFGFVKLSKDATTGSSIMPHKNNPDVLEMLRASAGKVAGYQHQIQMISNNLPSGYNKDHQEMKMPLIEAFEISIVSLEALLLVLEGLKINKEAMANALTEEMGSAKRAADLALGGKPFREAYLSQKSA
ncbi:argininosuccinate lyase [Candidatus Micrarchaeota archaeon]|nr:argininosuccinate lyase [Candidatus Micrarchaeota archaeon]